MYIKLYRLVDGAHIIGKQEKHCIKDALQVSMTPEEQKNEAGEVINVVTRIGVVPMLYPFVGKHTGTEISLDHVVCSEDCPSALLNVYLQAVSTTENIQIPTLENVNVENIQQGPL